MGQRVRRVLFEKKTAYQFRICIKIIFVIKVSYIFSPTKNIFMRFLTYPTSIYIYIYIYICVAPRSRGEYTNVVLLDSLRSLYCHKPELSSLISKKVVYNYLNFKSVENICSGINIKGTVTSSI